MNTNRKIIGIIVLTLFITVIIICSGLTPPAYKNIGDAITAQLKAIKEKNPFEKIYLHVDKPMCKPGEDIWFSVYLIDGKSNKSSTVSHIVYVDLINPKGNIEKTLKLEAQKGYCYGDFKFGKNQPGGIYKLRAYTNWMKNFGKENFFEKEIQVHKIVYPRLLSKLDFTKKAYGPGSFVCANFKVENLENIPLRFKTYMYDVNLNGKLFYSGTGKTDNAGKTKISFKLPNNLNSNDGLLNVKIENEGTTESISRSIPIVLNKIQVRFFPEGGSLIQNVDGKVAFEATNEFGKPADIEGEIYNTHNKKILSLKSYHDGMGTFTISCKKDDRYFLKITQPEGVSESFELPIVLENGYSLQVEKDTTNKKLNLTVYSPVDKEMYLNIHNSGSVLYSIVLEVKKGINKQKINYKDMPTGIATITLLDHNQIPRCERLVFLNYPNQLKIEASFEKKVYQPREKINLEICTKDQDNLPIPARLSIAVVNDQLLSYADDKSHNILSWLLFGAELKGDIYEPSFYFNPEKDKAEHATDLLMLTHGWRCFDWSKDFSQNNNSLQYIAEKSGIISGKVIHKQKGTPLIAEVILLELNGDKKFVKIETNENGKFAFLDINPGIDIQILARSEDINPNDIQIELSHTCQFKDGPQSEVQLGVLKADAVPEIIYEKVTDKKEINEIVDKANQNIRQVNRDRNAGFMMAEDVQRLDEVVVVGYGANMKSDLTGCLVSVAAENVNAINGNFAEILQGNVPGVEVVNSSGRPGAPVNIKIRGNKSLVTSNPLFVVDGVVVNPDINSNASPLGMISPDDVESIEVLKDAAASAMYGCQAANGVILISTRNKKSYKKAIPVVPKPTYAGLKVTPSAFSAVREFYYPIYQDEKIPEKRTDFRNTVYWNPLVITNTNGKAKVSFYNSDDITTFKTIIEGLGANGNLGRTEESYASVLPISLDVKMPAFVTFSDTVEIPIFIKNNTNEDQTGMLNITLPDVFQLVGTNIKISSQITISADSSLLMHVPVFVKAEKTTAFIDVSFKTDAYSDAFTKNIELIPKGFPSEISISGNEAHKTFEFSIPEHIPNSLSLEFNAYPDVSAELMKGIESIIREPYGCFEQTSSSTYPNIMVLKYLKNTGKINREIENRALTYIDKGYKRLIGFETKEQGFEWFGNTPPHEGLTTYGIMEFTEMKEVYPQVSDDLIQRTQQWILSRRDGNGGFNKRNNGLDNFRGASYEITNAYLVYGLSESGYVNIEKEYNKAFNEALKSEDLYRMALLANAAFNLEKWKDGNTILAKMDAKINKLGLENATAEYSIVRSYGNSLNVEIVSLYTLAKMKSSKFNKVEVGKLINYLASRRNHGGFGSTQATILALKAMVEFSYQKQKSATDGKILISVNNTLLDDLKLEKSKQGGLIAKGLEKYLQKGDNKIEIEFTDPDNVFPYSFDGSWISTLPNSSSEAKVALSTILSKNTTKVGENVRLTINLKNKHNHGLPMTMAIVGIPSGLSLQAWQLKELQEKHVFDFYETTKNYLVCYFTSMEPNEVKTINLDLKAEIPGYFQAPASNGYLYYTAEDRHWIYGESIKIMK